MKAKLITATLVAGTVGAVLLYPAFRGYAGGAVPPARPQAVVPTAAAKVEVVFALDTTGSMSGLIEAAKEKIWSIASTLAQAQQAPEIRMGLVAYRDRGDAYVTRVVDLGADLDSMYAALMELTADGGGDGPEDVNRALHDAVHAISWSQDPSAYKVVFLVGDAPPHMDYQGEPRYPEIVAAAAAKGIVVNTIQCGGLRETTAPWQHIAALGGGRYFQVEQDGNAVVIDTPFDAEMARLAAELDATRYYYGSREERAAADAKLAATERLAAQASVAALARRGAFNASASGAANLAGDNELVADVASGGVDLAAVPEAHLPPALAELPPDERWARVEEAAARRAELQRRMVELAADRDAYIAERVAESGGAADSLDVQLYDAVREQAAPKGLVYDGGPKF